jgi:hypothetical protein
MTAPEIINLANDLARSLYRVRGYTVPEGYRFDKATHAHEREAWAGAREAFLLLRDTDLDDVISELDEEQPR